MLLDGAIIQMMYRFNRRGSLNEHRLAFYPNPNLERYQDSPDDYEDRYYGNKLFTEMYENVVVAFPVRFDFNNDPARFVELDHPQSHMTVGNYQNCRIPVSHPITPYRFMDFILRNFYFDKFKSDVGEAVFNCSLRPTKTITALESKKIHLGFEF